MSTKPTVFITGVAGFLGSHMADMFIKKDYRVVGCDNLIGGYLDNVPAEVEFYQYDCDFHNSMVKITRGVDIVIHCAATAYEGLSVFSPYVVTKNIVNASVSVITAAIANGCKRFIYCSSMARYGEQPTVPFTEDMTPLPQDPYGIGKYSGEMFLKNLCDIHGMDFTIVVPHNIIGPRQKYDDPYRNVASIMINLMLQGRQPIIYGNGEQMRCFSFVHDILPVFDKLVETDILLGETVNIGPDEEFVTINQLAETLADLLDFDLKPIYFPDRPQEVKLANCSAEKARKYLDYKTQTSLRDGLSEMIDYIKNRGPKKFKYHLDLEIVNEMTPKTWKDRVF